MPQQTAYFPLGGGLDLITPAIALKPGFAIASLNYEPVANGYRRCGGFERFDGRVKPSEAPYYQLNFDTGSALFSAGNTVTGLTSGATGVVLANGTVTSGDVAAGNAAGYLGLGAVSGTFVDNEELQVGGVTRALANGTTAEGAAPTVADGIAWLLQATANARALIQVVPGSGPVRGVWVYNGSIYAFRDNAGGTAGVMHKSSAAGWVAQSLGFTLDFTSGGTYEPQVGDIITGATSGATATLTAVVKTSGSYSAGDAAGYYVFTSATGTFQAENLNIGANLNVATIAGDKVATTLPAGGRYEFINHNFYGTSSLERMYGCNGVGRAFEWDGATFVPIRTGQTNDTPHRIAENKNHLFLAFPGGMVDFSSIGAPREWLVVTGAGEFGMGSEITDFIPNNFGALTVLAEGKIANVYGSSSSDFQLQTISDEAGAVPFTANKVGEALYMDARGLRKLSTTAAFGNFNIGTLTQMVKPLLQDHVAASVAPIACVRVRDKDQYRIFFDNEDGLTVFLGRKNPEILQFNLGKVVRCICSAEMDDGEAIFFGSDDGYIYQLDKGTSFDGAAIDYSIRLPFNHLGAPQLLKRWHKVVIECEAIPEATLEVSADFDYGDPYEAGVAGQDAPSQTFTVTGGGGIWDRSSWNQFYWSTATEALAEAWLDGVGRNMSLLIAGSTADEPPHLLQGLTLFFSGRGLQR